MTTNPPSYHQAITRSYKIRFIMHAEDPLHPGSSLCGRIVALAKRDKPFLITTPRACAKCVRIMGRRELLHEGFDDAI